LVALLGDGGVGDAEREFRIPSVTVSVSVTTLPGSGAGGKYFGGWRGVKFRAGGGNYLTYLNLYA
jgi:hypothetical protein